MSFSTNKSGQSSTSSGSSATRPTTPQELTDYFLALDRLTAPPGGGGGGAAGAGGGLPAVSFVPGAAGGGGGGGGAGPSRFTSNYFGADPLQAAGITYESPQQPPNAALYPPANPAQSQGAGGGWSYKGQLYPTQAAAEAARAADAQGAQVGGAGGRLLQFAREGTPAVGYDELTAQQLRALGGAGATRELAAGRAYGDQMDAVRADPRLSVAQGQRTRELATREYQGNLDAVAKEVEALLTGVSQEERKRRYEAAVRNSELTREDLAALANIFFGGKGQYATSSNTSQGKGDGGGFNVGLPLF